MSGFLERLREYKKKDDRGMMATLRCVLVENKKHRAWPALNRLGVKIDDDISAYIAGLFATHPKEISKGNLGTTCKAVEQKRSEVRSTDNKLTPTERRFQHLLASEKGEDLEKRVLRMVLMAKSQDVPVNYERLKTDIRWWNARTKTEWASAFWIQEEATDLEEENL